MRLAFLVFSLMSFSAGCSNYVTERVIPTGCIKTKYYLDTDQDGWGARPSGEDGPDFVLSCDPAAPYTARNSLDCDDNNAQTTGRVGSVCPEDTVKGANDYASKVVGTREYVAIVGDTLSGSEASLVQCGATGWGGRWGDEEAGGLATFTSMQGMFRLIKQLDDKLAEKDQKHYAGWVGVVSSDNTSWVFGGNEPEEADEADEEDEAEDTFLPAQMGFCGGTAPPPATTARLALVRTYDAGDWCFGTPTDANPPEGTTASPIYTDFRANFVCERPRPDVRCFVSENDTPWLEPCSCRIVREKARNPEVDVESTLVRYYDPARLLSADTGLYESKYGGKLCLDPTALEEPEG